MPEAGLSLGSNLGDKTAMIEAALAKLEASEGVRVVRRSKLYRTEPWGKTDQDWFVNACAIVDTVLTPRALLDLCLGIERKLGRAREKEERWGPRSIDIDLLFYADAEMNEPDLQLPHPRLFERAFVLVPLAEIGGDRAISGRRIADAARAIDTTGVGLWSGTQK